MKAGDVQKPVRNPKFRTTTFTFVEPLATEEYDPITQNKSLETFNKKFRGLKQTIIMPMIRIVKSSKSTWWFADPVGKSLHQTRGKKTLHI